MKAPAGNRFADRLRKGGVGRISSPLGSGGTGARSVGRLVGSLGLFASVVVLSLSVLGSAAASSAFAEACPNETLRAENNSLAFAGCRALEQVTPAFQNGFGAATLVGFAPGGEEMIATSTSAFAGAESSRFGPFYKMTRTAGGWQTQSISPPASIFSTNFFDAGSADLSRSLWTLRSPDQSIYAQDLYRREPDGSFVKVGPMVPPSSESGPRAGGLQRFFSGYEFRGASADLSHVYFSIDNGVVPSAVVWPGDTTASFNEFAAAFSLYEYTGVGNTTPALVGVDGQGRLISDCATFLGAPENQEMYNAVSTDGSKAFFTAFGHDQEQCPAAVRAPEVTEVYARLGGQQTVAISEPTAQDCEACITTVRKPARFQGASADGSRVFFTTTQELLPGAAGDNLYEFDFSAALGRRVRLLSSGPSAAEVLGVARVSEDGSHVYFVADGTLSGPNAATGNAPVQGQPNLYVYAREAEHPLGQVSFVATLAESDEQDWGPSDLREVQATPEGGRLVFVSRAALTPDVSGEERQVYEYDAPSEELIRVSRGQNGYPQGTANVNAAGASLEVQLYSFQLKPVTANTFLAITDNGSDVMFSSPAALTPANEEAAEAKATSVYEYRSAGPISDGDVFPLAAGRATQVAQGFSHDGKNAFVRSEAPLAGGQTDLQRNIFDAREYGGFPAPVPPAGCLGESCLQAAPQPPSEPPPPGTLAATAGNQPPPVHKKKPKNKKHNTKKHHGKKNHGKGGQKKQGRANSDRGGHK